MINQRIQEAADQFKDLVQGDTMGEHYDAILPETYNEMCKTVNFSETGVIAK